MYFKRTFLCLDRLFFKGQVKRAHIHIIWYLEFNATFSNISAISWRPVLLVEEADVPGENHRPWASNW